MHKFGWAALSAAAMSLIHCVPARAEPVSLWDLNGSTISLHTDGTSRALRYHDPRLGMREEGVRRGTLLFSGTQQGNAWSGTGYVFSRRCGALPYPVTGTLIGERRIRLYGSAPTALDAGCRPVRYEHDVNEFKLLKVIAATPGLSAKTAEQDRTEKRLAELRAQEARLERERKLEEQRLGELRTYAANRQACLAFDAAACDRALASPRATAQEAGEIHGRRKSAVAFHAAIEACRTGSVTDCDAALASPAMTGSLRPQVMGWRHEASPVTKARTGLSVQWGFLSNAAAHLASDLPKAPLPVPALLIPATLLLLSTILLVRYRPMLAVARARSRTPDTTGEDPADAGKVEPSASCGSGKRSWTSLFTSLTEPPSPQPASDKPSPTPVPGALAFIHKAWTAYKVRRQAKADREKELEAEAAARAAVETAANRERNSKAAAEALRVARSYLDDWYKDGGSVSQMHDAVKFATKYLQQARTLNPMVQLTVEGKNGLVTYTQDELAAEALYLEACLSEGTGEYDFQHQNAFEALKKAAAYNPTAPHIHRKIAEMLLKLYRRSDALKAAEFALSLDPSNIESRKLFDKIDATPSLGVKQKKPGSGYAAAAKFFWGLAFIFCLLLPGMFLMQRQYGNAIASFLYGLLMLGIAGKFSDWAFAEEITVKAMQREHYRD